MSDTNDAATGDDALKQADGQAQGQEQAGPPLMIVHQYLKDLSFENPSTPARPYTPDQKTDVNVKIDVTASHLQERMFEVALHIEFKATAEEDTIYMGELIYACIVQVGSVRQEDLEPLLLIEVARQLFPYARSIVSSAVQNGGFPPLLLAPFDFVQLYRQRVAARAAETKSTEAPADGRAPEQA